MEHRSGDLAVSILLKASTVVAQLDATLPTQDDPDRNGKRLDQRKTRFVSQTLMP